MTHAEKIADYRTALTANMKLADEIMEQCKDNKSEWDTWFGIQYGYERALSLTKILD